MKIIRKTKERVILANLCIIARRQTSQYESRLKEAKDLDRTKATARDDDARITKALCDIAYELCGIEGLVELQRHFTIPKSVSEVIS